MRATVLAVLATASVSCGGGGAGTRADAAPGAGDGAAPDAPVDTDPERWVVDVSECPAAYQAAAPVAGTNTNFVVGGQARSFVLIPPAPGAPGPRPLFVGFHGTSEDGAAFVSRARLADFAARGFLVLAPSAAGNGTLWPVWDALRAPGDEAAPNADLAFFDALIRCTAAHHEVDRKRIYVGGHSAGGIFTNRVLRSRADVVAGGIVASGIFDLTGPGPAAPVLAIVTWGGDNDRYAGTTPNGVTVPNISFVEQAALASQHYEAQPGSTQIACRGDDLGHAWLPLNAWFADALLARPQGAPADAPLPALPTSPAASCSPDAYVLPPAPPLVCPASTSAGCQAACQLIADCIVENHTVGSVMAAETTALGLSPTSCGGCVERCEAAAGSAADQQVLACLANAQASATCGPGIEGALPFMQAFNTCCANRPGSALCVGTCAELDANEAITPFFPVCATL